jgi:hypothetical protein
MSQKWVVVTDQNTRIFAMDSPSAPLREIENLLHPAGRQRAQELKSDRPPRLFRGKGEASHPVEAKVDVKEQEVINFARRIADRSNHTEFFMRCDWYFVADPKCWREGRGMDAPREATDLPQVGSRN